VFRSHQIIGHIKANGVKKDKIQADIEGNSVPGASPTSIPALRTAWALDRNPAYS